jgi:hypothetical protein
MRVVFNQISAQDVGLSTDETRYKQRYVNICNQEPSSV